MQRGASTPSWTQRLAALLGVSENRGDVPGVAQIPTDSQNAKNGAKGFGLLFGCIWLVFLKDAVRVAWGQADSWQGQLALVTLTAFGAVYAVHFLKAGFGAFQNEEQKTPRSPGTFVTLLGLAIVCVLLIGRMGLDTIIFLEVAALWSFRLLIAWGTVLALMVANVALSMGYFGRGFEWTPIIISFWVVAAASFWLIASQRRRELHRSRVENTRLAVEAERTRMARDVHDILGHSLTVITVKAELAQRLFVQDPHRAQVELESLENLAREALRDVRRTVEGFRDITLPGEISRAKNAFAAADIMARLPSSVELVAPDLRELFAWTIREAVTNVLKHSEARTCTVVLEAERLSITDDGRGSRPAKGDQDRVVSGGRGLNGLAERAEAVNATLRVEWPPEGGYRLVVHRKGDGS